MLATAGVAVGHIVGYAVAHPDGAAREVALGGHAYLPAAASVVIPLGIAGALWWAVTTARALGLAGVVDLRRLAAAQLALFAVQEVGERVVGGEAAASVLGERGVWFGLLAQVLVAHLSVRAIEWTRRVVRAVVTGTRPSTSLSLEPRLRSFPVAVPATRSATVSVGLRAPPVGP